MSLRTHLRLASIWLLLALLTPKTLLSQQQPFHRYGLIDGLSNLNVRCLLEDRTGYIWVGTDNGLFRYDGSSFREFNHEDGLTSTEIEGLAESPGGDLWVATQEGVARFSGTRFQPVDVGASGPFGRIFFDSLGRMVLQSASGILNGVPDGAGVFHFHPMILGVTRGLLVNGTKVFFGKDDDLWQLDGDKAERLGSSGGLPSDQWAAISMDSFDNLWVRSATRLYKLSHGQRRFVDRSEGVPRSSLSYLYADQRGRLYVSGPEGLIVVEESSTTSMDSHHGLPSDTVNAALVDREESLWIGTSGGGLIRRLGRGEWSSWKKEDGLLHDSIWATYHDEKGQTWVGSYGGLNILSPLGNVVRSWTSQSGLAGDQVASIVEGPEGDFYVGTNPAGISHFNSQGSLLRTYRSTSGYAADRISALLVDKKRKLWAMGLGGCFRTRNPLDASGKLSFERITVPGLPPETSFRTAVVDEDGTVWIGTSRGLARFDGVGWKVFTVLDGLKSPDIAAVVSRHGEVWIAYRDALGIAHLRYNAGRIDATHFTMREGLVSNLAYALAFDHAGQLWVNTDRGVAVFDQGHWLHYGSADGLVWDDTNGVALNVDFQGSVWIGTSGGLSRYTPLPYAASENPTPIVITSIKGDVSEWQPGGHPVLSHSERYLSIRYAGLSFSPESSVRFRYRLLGLGNAWTETSERGVRLTGPPAGDYTFEVIAEGSSHLWSTVPARFSFVIKPPWWQTWWFIAACLLTTALTTYSLWHLRMRALKIQKGLLEQQVARRTTELVESQRQLREIAYCDMLTSLPNRRGFSEELRKRIASACLNGKTFAMIMFDLDHFKQINDTFGHDAGDLVLLETAVRLRVAIREQDCVARLGGDEFAILINAADDKETVEIICRRILDSFTAGIRFGEENLKVGCSLGIAVFPHDCTTGEKLYKAADRALYCAKRNGRNSFCWHRPLVL